MKTNKKQWIIDQIIEAVKSTGKYDKVILSLDSVNNKKFSDIFYLLNEQDHNLVLQKLHNKGFVIDYDNLVKDTILSAVFYIGLYSGKDIIAAANVPGYVSSNIDHNSTIDILSSATNESIAKSSCCDDAGSKMSDVDAYKLLSKLMANIGASKTLELISDFLDEYLVALSPNSDFDREIMNSSRALGRIWPEYEANKDLYEDDEEEDEEDDEEDDDDCSDCDDEENPCNKRDAVKLTVHIFNNEDRLVNTATGKSILRFSYAPVEGKTTQMIGEFSVIREPKGCADGQQKFIPGLLTLA